ncbi:MAG TPA: class I SAM-dependent methyltransferase [Arthrobacter sp.]|nr:class I SAM-dependent methyltransferase [Arthrobacter sp.]
MSDYDARLVDLYDHDNPDGPDHDFYRSVADEYGADSILDLGCGTGILTATFAQESRTVLGVDPSEAMLAFARCRQGADAADWILGDSRAIPPRHFDVAVLTGNVVQHILDPEWQRTLLDLRAHLRVGGVLAFDSRNPGARAWESWGSQERSRRDTPHGPLLEWADVSELDDGVVTARFHNEFLRTGERVTETARFAFRHAETLGQQLAAAGFDVDAVYGDWARTLFTPDASFMVFIAHAR